jgi:AcrR family transcriptional regulator
MEQRDEAVTITRSGVGTGTVGPRSRKGERTRRRILEAARVVFARDGYLKARMTDVAEAAGLAHGALYRYFRNKEDILLGLLEPTIRELYAETAARRTSERQYDRLVEGIRGYLEVYERNADVMKILIEAAMENEEVADIWRRLRVRFHQRILRHVERNRELGLARDLEPVSTAQVLGGMVEHFAFLWFVLQERQLDGRRPTVDEAVETLATIWHHGLFVDREKLGTPPALDETD